MNLKTHAAGLAVLTVCIWTFIFTVSAAPASTGQPPMDTENSTSPADSDYLTLQKMWSTVNKMTTEQEVKEYIANNTPFLIKEKGKSAYKILGAIFKMHNHWGKLRYHEYRLKALDMIAQMFTMADSPQKQNDVYDYILRTYRKEQLDFYNIPNLKKIGDIINNNKLYLSLLESWSIMGEELTGYGAYNQKRKHRQAQDEINSLLIFELLTVEQAIQAHYIKGELNAKIPGSAEPECYHYGKCRQLMKDNQIHIIYLETPYKKAVIKQDSLDNDICHFCTFIKRSTDAVNSFNTKFSNEGMTIESLTRECTESRTMLPKSYETERTTDKSVAHYNSKPGPQPAMEADDNDAQQGDKLSRFLHQLRNFVISSVVKDYNVNIICRKLLMSSYSKAEFSRVIKNYPKDIPKKYNYSLNQFFYTLYARNKGWYKDAHRIIRNQDWPVRIKLKLKETLDEVHRIYN